MRVQRVSPTALAVTWDLIDTSAANVKGYVVYYSMKPSDDMSKWWSKESGVLNKDYLEGLEPHTVYAVRVRARDDNNRLGELSDIVSTNSIVQSM